MMKLTLHLKNILFSVITVSGFLLCLTSANAQFIDKNKIIAGSDMTFFPYEYMEKDKPAGFDIEFMNGVAAQMGKVSENIDTRWANLIPGLRGGRFDIINSSMYITPERVKVIDMIPYLKSGESILSLKGNDYQPKKPEDFCGYNIGSMAGTSWLQQLKKLSVDYCEKKGLKPILIREYATDPETTQALLSHAVDAQITDAAVAKGVIKKLGNRIVISSDTLLYPVLNGIGIKKENVQVKTALILAIDKYKKTSEYKELIQKYDFIDATDEDIKAMMPK